MAILAYSALVPDVVVYATGCPTPTIVEALRKSARQFFIESTVYRVWLSPFNLTLDTTTYTIPGLPSETEVTQLLVLKCNGIDVQERTHDEFFALDPEWPTAVGAQPLHFTTLNTKDTFNIIPKPTATVASAFNAQVALIPTLAATGVEQKFLEEWKEGIVDGALSRLLRIKDRPWSDDKEAAIRLQSFVREYTFAKIQASKGNVRRDVRVQMRRWV